MVLFLYFNSHRLRGNKMPIYIGGNRIKNMFDTFSEAYIDEALLDLIQGTLPDDGSTVPDSPTPDIHIDEYRNINRIISNINLILGNCNLRRSRTLLPTAFLQP